MLFWSRKPEGWRCLLPVSSGPYTDLGSASTMGLVLKAFGSGAPDHRIDVTLILLIGYYYLPDGVTYFPLLSLGSA